MPMTKKEKAALEDALTVAALRYTADAPEPDVMPPKWGELSNGFVFVAEKSDHPRVEPACSSSTGHAVGCTDKTTSQGARSLYSTRLMALKSLRNAVEKNCAKRLRKIDKMIEAEETDDCTA